MITNIFENSVKKALNETFEADGNFYVYHGTQPRAEKGLLSTGFERSWTSSNGGNMYGKGVYTTFTFSRNGSNARGGYGDTILKARVKSLNNFIIYIDDIAKQVYGEFNVEHQLIKVFGNKFVDELRHTYETCSTPEGWSVTVTFDKVINSQGRDKSSESALALAAFIHTKHKEAEYQVNGYVFCGNHDADVCFIKDFKNVYPVAISHDRGRTFTPIINSKGDAFDKFAKNDIDLHFQLGKLNYKLFRELDEFPNYFINNYARVRKGGKYNFLWRGRSLKLGVISPVWFDTAPETFSDSGKAIVTIDETPYIIVNNKGDFLVYTKNGNYICNINDFAGFLSRFSYEDEFDEEF